MTRNTILIAGAAVVFGMWWTAPLRHQAEYFNECVQERVTPEWSQRHHDDRQRVAMAVKACNGGNSFDY